MNALGYSTEGFARSVHRIDGVDTVVYEIGAGQPVVYFHGGGTFHGFDWARDLADRFRMILPHHPNFGDSGDADFASVGDYMLHYEMLFAAMELDSFHLMGASMGGHFAARYAGDHRDEVERLVLVSPAGMTSEHVSMPDLSQVSAEERPGLLVSDRAWLAPYWPDEPSPEWLALRQREGVAAGQMRGDPARTDAALRQALSGYRRPVMLLWGDHDRVVPPGLIPEWQAALPEAEVAVIAGGGHLLLDEFPEARQAAREFLLAG